MERIKRALELAEQDRLALTEGTLADSEHSHPAMRPAGLDGVRIAENPETACRGAAGGQAVPAGQPEIGRFIRTRVVPVSPDHLERNRIILPDSGREASRAYDMLASRLLERASASGWNSIALVSPGSGEGKTVTGINLAIHLAASKERTALLVDMDFRRPSVARYLGLQPESGVEDVLATGADTADALVCPGISRFSVLPVRTPHLHTSDFIDSQRCRDLALELKRRYANRVVLFDLPPLLAYGDALRFMPCVDAALMVVEEGKTRVESIERALSALSGQNLVGVVMNGSSETVAGY